MKEIDFIPAWHISARTRRRDFTVRGAYLGVVLAAMGGLTAIRYAQIVAAERSLARLQPIPQPHLSAEHLSIRWAELQRRQRLLAEVNGGAPVHAILGELSALLPEAAVMAHLQVNESPQIPASSQPALAGIQLRGDGRLEMLGWAASDGQVGHLMSRMSGSRAFTDLKLGYSKPVQVEGREAREFKLACRLPSFK